MLFTYNFLENISQTLLSIVIYSVYINFFDSLFLIILLSISWYLCINNSFRAKFIYFLFLLGSCSLWGFMYSFDGIVLLFLLVELLVILLFLLLFSTTNINISTTNNSVYGFFIYLFIGLGVYYFNYYLFGFYSISSISNSIYTYSLDIISGDFFIFFFFFFLVFPEATFIVAVLLGLFSIFFIFFYFTLKFSQQQNLIKNTNYSFVRKQQMIHQSSYNTSLYTFQK